ncbi:hypothetical protein [Flavobacterium sp. C3NV]|uniref:hypothetical protein n=1 Tax=Flavobacterium sp. C3NV TaxID=3393358 RepID=UPI00398F9FEC
MALQTLNTIKQWFKTGLKPTQTQFWDTWDSFRHKFEKVPVKDIEGIDELLLTKVDKTVLDNHIADKNAHAPQVNTDWNSESGFSQLINKPEFKTINGEPIVGSGDISLDVESLTFDQVLSNGNETTQTALFKSYGDNDVYTNIISGRNIEMTQSSTVTRGENKTASLTLSSELIDFVNSKTGETTALFAQGVGFGNLNSNHFSTLEMNPATTANYSTVLMPAITEEGETKTLATLDDIPKVNPQSLEETLRAGNNSGGEIRLHDTGATFRLSQIRPDYGENYDLGRFGTLPSQGVSNTGYLMLGKEFGPNVYQTSLLPNSESTANTELFLPKADGTAKTLATTDEINNPVSATQSGIVDNIPLQELGGTDKLINGIRIGQGSRTGNSNTAIGVNVMSSTTTGSKNTGVGFGTLENNTEGESNTGLGEKALHANTTGSYNDAFGCSALSKNTTAIANTAVGSYALAENLTSPYNVAIGCSALSKMTSGLGQSTAIGAFCMSDATSTDKNAAIGTYALRYNTSGFSNTAIGHTALGLNTSGNSNNAVGNYSLGAITTGAANIGIGKFAGRYVTTGIGNIYIGSEGVISDAEANGIINIGNRLIVKGPKLSLIGTLNIGTTPVYEDNLTALAGGLTAGDLYRTATGILMITF